MGIAVMVGCSNSQGPRLQVPILKLVMRDLGPKVTTDVSSEGQHEFDFL